MLKYRIRTLLFIINKFIHDLSSGIWIGTILALYLLDKKAGSSEEMLQASELHDVMRVFFWVGIFALVVIFVTGVFWFLNYGSEEYGGVSERDKKKLLIVKHVLLGIIFLGGTYLAYSYTFR